jgi:hypothetical protein
MYYTYVWDLIRVALPFELQCKLIQEEFNFH